MNVQNTELVIPALKELLEAWMARCDGGNPPLAAAMSPADLRAWKDHLVIFEVVAEDAYVYTYYGKALTEAFGQSRLGATLSDLPEPQRTILASEYAGVISECLPVARLYTADFDGVQRTFERLVLPLLGETGTVDKLLVAAYEVPTAIPAPADTQAEDLTA